MSRFRLLVLTLVLRSSTGCGGDEVALDLRFEARGPHPVGNTTIAVEDANRDRRLTIELWYPAADSAAAAKGVLVADLEDPIGFLVAVEDNSITELGNIFIRRNFEDAPVPAWKGEVADAGHWSFSDICGLDDQFAACCGAGVRQTDLTDFAYLPIATGLAVAQAYVTAFFAAHLLDDPSGRRYLEEARPSDLVALEQHD